MKLKNLETPALIIDELVMEENMDCMMTMLEDTRIQLRPHYKTHKSPDLAWLQIEKGAKGITCSKLSEAEDLVKAGIYDILIANQVVQKAKIVRLASLAGMCHMTVCVDSEQNIRDLSAAACLAGTVIHCYVELDIGMKRCGVSTFEEFYKLAALLEELPGVSYDGIQAYAGNLSHEFDVEKREAAIEANEERLRQLIAYLDERGIKNREVSGCSTGTIYMKKHSTVYTELQPGAYIFMDMAYRGMKTVFKNSLYVLATVVSADDDRFVTDAGAKSVAWDEMRPGLDGMEFERSSIAEEHSTFYGSHSLKVGDLVKVMPGHCGTTVNLYDEMYLVDGDTVIDRITVVSRGKAR